MRLLLVLPLLAFGFTVQAALPDRTIEEFLDSEIVNSGAPGISYGVLDDGEIRTAQRGTIRLDSNEPVTAQSPFLIGSITKSFTSLAVMQLVEQEALDLDAPLSDYLDGFESGTRAGDTTIRQLMSHTSGYSMYQGNAWQDDAGMATDALEKRVEEIAELEPDRDPDKSWDYSNINYMLLGRLIEVASKQSYKQYIETQVLKPAGMTDSYVHSTSDDPRLVVGHTPWFNGKRALEENATGLATAAPGGIVSTARDLLLFLEIMMNREDDILSASNKALMMQPASEISPFYGLGWFIYADQGAVSHSGSNPGYEALATMVPQERRAAVILTNSGSGFALKNGFALQYGFVDRALGIDTDPSLPGSSALAMFIYACLAPIIFVFAMVLSWRGRQRLREKSGALGQLSLWFPVFVTAGQAAILMLVLPRVYGAPLQAIREFHPDTWTLLIATAVSGLVWSFFRLAVHYSKGDEPLPSLK